MRTLTSVAMVLVCGLVGFFGARFLTQNTLNRSHQMPIPPKPGKMLDFKYGTSEVLHTNLTFKNEHNTQIYIDNVKLVVSSFGRWHAPKDVAWARKISPKQFLLRNLDKKDGHVFFGRTGMALKAGEEVEVQVRVMHEEFPTTTAKGDLVIEYCDEHGNKGVLTLKGISIDIESW